MATCIVRIELAIAFLLLAMVTAVRAPGASFMSPASGVASNASACAQTPVPTRAAVMLRAADLGDAKKNSLRVGNNSFTFQDVSCSDRGNTKFAAAIDGTLSNYNYGSAYYTNCVSPGGATEVRCKKCTCGA